MALQWQRHQLAKAIQLLAWRWLADIQLAACTIRKLYRLYGSRPGWPARRRPASRTEMRLGCNWRRIRRRWLTSKRLRRRKRLLAAARRHQSSA